MTTLAEKIEIMTAFQNGERIEFMVRAEKDYHWEICSKAPCWDWHTCEYRIAKPESKKIKLLAWFDTATLRLQWLGEGSPVSGDWERVPSEDKEITLP